MLLNLDKTILDPNYLKMMRVSRPWTGKSNNLPNDKKKEAHKNRKCKKIRLYEIKEKDFDIQIREYNEGK